MVDIPLLLFVLSAPIYPIIVLTRLIRRAGVRKGTRFLVTCNSLAIGANDLIADRYKELGFAANLGGALLELSVSEFLGPLLPKSVLLGLFAYHISLTVIYSVGIGLLRMARTRLLLFFTGETFGSWALIGGNLLLLYVIASLSPVIGIVVLGSLFLALLAFLSVLLLRFYESGGIYAKGAQKA